jgi:hypothetical protein
LTPRGLDQLVDGLPGFFETLRRQAGFGIEPTQVLSAQSLVLNLAVSGQLPDSLSRLKTLIGPIVCATKRQQDEFSRRFDIWVAAIEPSESAAPGPRTPADLGLTLNEIATKGHRASVRAWPLLVVAALVILGTVYAVTVWLSPKPDATPATSPPAESAPRPGVTPDPTKVTPPVTPPPPSDSGIRSALPTVLGVAVGVGFELVAGYWLLRRLSRHWWDRQAEMILRRREASGTPRTTVLKLRPPEPWPAAARQQLGRAAVGLLRRRLVEAGGTTIDVGTTLDRTVRRIGPPGPVTASRLVTPEYLVLIDRVSLHDHQADWADSLVDRLVADQVSVVRFEFTADPRVCYPRRESRSAWTLRDLSERYADYRLLLFTDGDGLLDPWTGFPAAWAELFSAWDVRAMLTPIPPASWTAREDQLASAGFLVEPATPDGLVALASLIAARDGSPLDAPLVPVGVPVPPLPEHLRYEPERWTDPTPPPATEVEEVVRELRWYLKGDYNWLAACAIYPELRWDLTLELGRVLSVLDGRPYNDSAGLSRLVRLPWFRQGSLPDWLRVWLCRDLEGRPAQAVRGALEQLLVGSERVENAGFTTGPTLAIAQAAGGTGTLSALAQGIRRSLARGQALDEPLNDHVFACFLEGLAPEPTDFRLSAGARALLDAVPSARAFAVVTPVRRWTIFNTMVIFPAYWLYRLFSILGFVSLIGLGALVLYGFYIGIEGLAIIPALLIIPLFFAGWYAQWSAFNLPARVAQGRTVSGWRRALHVAWVACLLVTPMIVLLNRLVASAFNPVDVSTRTLHEPFPVSLARGLLSIVSLCAVAAWLWYVYAGKPVELAIRLHRRLWVPLALMSVTGFALKDFLGGLETAFALFWLSMYMLLATLWPELTVQYLARFKGVVFPEPPADGRYPWRDVVADPLTFFRRFPHPLVSTRTAVNQIPRLVVAVVTPYLSRRPRA